MGQRESKLKNLIFSIYGYEQHGKLTSPELLNSKYGEYIYETYFALGGILSAPPTAFGKWDIPTRNFIIELDEEQHFNRYRLKTLESSFYSSYKLFPVEKYRNYCLDKEHACLRSATHGGYWKNDSSEKQFGDSQSNGMLGDRGSSRWKQRAYYDFLKDLTSKLTGLTVIRISIYDEFKNYTVEQLIKLNNYNLLAELVGFKIEGFKFVPEYIPPHVLEGIARAQKDFEEGRFITEEEFKKRLFINR